MVSTFPPFTLSPATSRKPVLSKGERRSLPFVLALFFSASQLSLAVAQIGGIPHLKPPPLVRIIGAFAPVDDTQRTSLQTLSVQVKGHKWRMRIREIKALTATTNSGWGLLKDLIPPHLHLTGPDELLAPLQQQEIAGKPFILEGRLYVGDHMLYLTAVTVNDP